MCRSEGVVKLARTQAKEKNNKPHEERRNQEQYKKATPSFSAWRLQLTVIFYHFAGGDKVFITTPQLYVFTFFTVMGQVSAGGKVEGAF